MEMNNKKCEYDKDKYVAHLFVCPLHCKLSVERKMLFRRQTIFYTSP